MLGGSIFQRSQLSSYVSQCRASPLGNMDIGALFESTDRFIGSGMIQFILKEHLMIKEDSKWNV